MSVDIIHIKPEQIARVDFTDPDTGEHLAVIRFAYVSEGYVSADITVNVGDHVTLRAWNDGKFLECEPVNTQLRDGQVKGVTLFGFNERYAA